MTINITGIGEQKARSEYDEQKSNQYVEDIAKRFDLHPPKTPAIGEQMDSVRRWYKHLALALEALPDSREKSLALTELETSLFWAIASIARSEENIR